MSASQSILVVVDPTADTHPAVRRAAWLASRMGGRVELFICEYEHYPRADKAAHEKLLEADRSRLQRMADELAEGSVTVDLDVRWDRPLDEGITRKVIDSKPSLVIKDTHYHSALKRSLFSNTDWNLIRHCPAPLLLVKDRDISDAVQIIAAVDPMYEHDKPATLDPIILSFAHGLATELTGELHAVHVFDAGSTLAAMRPEAVVATTEPDLLTELESRHRDALENLISSASIDNAHAHLEQGDPAKSLVDAAEELDADFVVIGAVSRGRWKDIIIGHTAERVLDRLHCDLIIVKPEDFESPISEK